MVAQKKPLSASADRLRWRQIVLVTAAVSSLTGVLVLAGWAFQLQPLVTIVPGFASMKPFTAVAFLLGGLSLVLLSRPSHAPVLTGQFCALLVFSIGLITLLEYGLNWNPGFDLLLFRAQVVAEAAVDERVIAGRMSQITALLFTLTGLALLLARVRAAMALILSQFLALTAFVLALLGLTSYLYGVESLYGVGPFSTFALHTSTTFLILTFGVLLLRPQKGVMPIFTANTIGAAMMRRLLFSAILVTVLLGWLSLQANLSPFFGTAFGLALLCIIYIVIFMLVVIRTSGNLNRIENLHLETESRLKQAELSANHIINTAMDAIITIDEANRIQQFNEAAEKMFGYEAEEMEGQALDMLLPEGYRAGHQEHIARFQRSGITKRRMGNLGEVYGRRRNGEEFSAEASISQLQLGGKQYFTAILRDISVRLEMQEALRVSNERLNLFIQYAPAAIAMLDRTMHYLAVSQRWIQDYQLQQSNVIGKSHYAIFPEIPEHWKAFHRRCLQGESISSPKDKFIRPDGRTEWLHWELHPWYIQNGDIGGLIIFTELITTQIEANEQIRRLNRIHKVISGINNLIIRVQNHDELLGEACRIAVEHAEFDIAWIGKYDEEKQLVSPLAMAGEGVEELLNKEIHLHNARGEPALIAQVLLSGEAKYINNLKTLDYQNRVGWGIYSGLGYNGIIVLPLKINNNMFGNLSLITRESDFFNNQELKLLREVSGDISFALSTLDIRQDVEKFEYFDRLTSLPNHNQFINYLNNAIVKHQEANKRIILIIGDVKRFHQINDTYGFQAGDELLLKVAERLRAAVSHPENLARVGGNSFATFLTNTSDLEVAFRIENLIKEISDKPFHINGEELQVSFSCGIASHPQDGNTAEDLYLNAEAALINAKRDNDHFKFYEPSLNARIAKSLQLETRLHTALKEGQFELYYQPKFNIANNRLTGVEALLRWHDPERGMISPGDFIPMLENTGLILDVGKWAINQALEDYKRWFAKGLAAPRIAVNITPKQLQHKDFVASVVNIIEHIPGDEICLDFEITESMIMENLQEILKKIQMIRGLGIEIAIDDFGTGYSSLNYLAKLPVNTVKIDRSFVAGIESDPYSLNIVKTIILLAHSLKLKVVAEGVEEPSTLEKLREMGCDQVQGYLVGKPMPANEMEALLAPRA